MYLFGNSRLKRYAVLFLLVSYFGKVSASAQTYSYDPTGRLDKIIYTNGTTLKYKYDAAGNLKKATVKPAVTASLSAEEVSGKTARFEVKRTGDMTEALTVVLFTEGEAVGGQDYSDLPGSVTIPAHESSVSFSVTLHPERFTSQDKKLVLSLKESDDYDVAEYSSATITLSAKK